MKYILTQSLNFAFRVTGDAREDEMDENIGFVKPKKLDEKSVYQNYNYFDFKDY